VGALEEVLLDPSFEAIKKKFCEEHCGIFDDKDENKIEYTEIFQRYTALIESTLDQKLTEKVPNFSMKRFETMLLSRQDEMDTEIFDLLLSLSDFDEFKEVMLSYKKPVKASSSSSTNTGVFDFAITGNKPKC
jgi:ADP-ribosylation factor 2-binding protein